jgi:hypothetical protein
LDLFLSSGSIAFFLIRVHPRPIQLHLQTAGCSSDLDIPIPVFKVYGFQPNDQQPFFPV